MEEVLLSIHPKYWDLIKSGKKTIEVRKSKPQNIFYPFRVHVYVTGGVGVVGKFDCDSTITTIKPSHLLNGSCLTEEELVEYASRKPLCGWHIKEGSIIAYKCPVSLERATGLKRPPKSWQYLSRENQ